MKKLFFLVCLGLPLAIYGQSITVDAGVSLGMSFYDGDLTPDRFLERLEFINPAVGVFGRVNFSERFSARLSTQFTTLSSDDENNNGNRQRRLVFKTNLIETTLMGEWNIMRIGNSRSGSIYPFVTAGFGGFYFNPTIVFENERFTLQQLGTEGQGLPGYPEKYKRFQAVVPFGVGLKIQIENVGQLAIEASFRRTFTDYLDDVSGVEVNYLDLLEADRLIAAQISRPRIDPNDPDPEEIVYIRGNFPKDWYHFLNISLAIPITTNTKNSWHKCPRL